MEVQSNVLEHEVQMTGSDHTGLECHSKEFKFVSRALLNHLILLSSGE